MEEKRELPHDAARLVKGWSEKLENFTVTTWEQFQAFIGFVSLFGVFGNLKATQ